MNMNFQKTINEFGAQPSESVLQTAFIQNALDACRDAGGGEVIVPAGHYLTGSIRLYDNTTLHLQENAVLIGSEITQITGKKPRLVTCISRSILICGIFRPTMSTPLFLRLMPRMFPSSAKQDQALTDKTAGTTPGKKVSAVLWESGYAAARM